MNFLALFFPPFPPHLLMLGRAPFPVNIQGHEESQAVVAPTLSLAVQARRPPTMTSQCKAGHL